MGKQGNKLWLQTVGNSVSVVGFFFPLSLKKKKKKSFKIPVDPGFVENVLLLRNTMLMGTDFS